LGGHVIMDQVHALLTATISQMVGMVGFGSMLIVNDVIESWFWLMVHVDDFHPIPRI